MAEDLAREVARLYEDAEAALLERLAAALEADIESPRWAQLKLASIGDLRQAVETVAEALQQDADGKVREALVEAYNRGRQAAVAELGALGIGRELVARQTLPNASAVDRLAASMARDTRPLYQRITRAVSDIYRRVVGRVTGGVLLGTMTRRQASQRALNQLAGRGITGFVDKAGKSWDMAAYAEMAVRSVTARAAIEGHIDALAEINVGLVIVSDAPLECPLCAQWEGEILTLADQNGPHTIRVEHEIEDDRTVVVHVAGSLIEARAAGLFHPNCRHSLAAYLPGVTTRPPHHPTPGTTYKDTQRQRQIERHIRRWKRIAAAAMDDDARRAANAKVREWQKAMREHVAAHEHLRRKPEREQLTKVTPQVVEEPVEAELPDDEPEPEPEPEREPEPVRLVSDATRATIGEVRSQLPQGRDGWLNARRTLIAAGTRTVDRRIAEMEKQLADLREKREQITAETEAEFRKRRTPKAKRPALLDEALRETNNEIRWLEEDLTQYREIAAKRLEDAANSNERYLLTEEGARHEFTYNRAANGRLMPPDEYERHLDSVLKAGEALNDDLVMALMADDELTQLHQKVRDLASSDNPNAEELRQAQVAVAKREAETVLRLLGEVRQMGGALPAKPADDATRGTNQEVPEDWQGLMQEALRHFPEEWLQAMRDSELQLIGSPRAFYRSGGYGRPDVLALPTSSVRYNGAFSSYGAEIAAHELGHRMEQYIAGLRELEFTLVRRRATTQGELATPQRLADIYPRCSYRESEITYEDEWADAYAGKTYEAVRPDDPASMSSEAFQVGMQDLFGRSGRNFGGMQLRQFVLGCLAAL
jgi:hypothetical protein